MVKIHSFYGNKSDHFEAVSAIRTLVFIDGQDCPYDEEFDGFDQSACHYLLMYDNEAAATARWRETEEGIKLERFAVLERFRGKGLANQLLERMLSDVDHFSKIIYLHAQCYIAPLYETAGFKAVGEPFFEVGIEHIKMVRKP